MYETLLAPLASLGQPVLMCSIFLQVWWNIKGVPLTSWWKTYNLLMAIMSVSTTIESSPCVSQRLAKLVGVHMHRLLPPSSRFLLYCLQIKLSWYQVHALQSAAQAVRHTAFWLVFSAKYFRRCCTWETYNTKMSTIPSPPLFCSRHDSFSSFL